MPTYSYRCTECDNAFDIKQSFSDATLTECPVCGGVLRKVFSPVGVTFNGGGFYRTDSRPAPKSRRGLVEHRRAKSEPKHVRSSGSNGVRVEAAARSKPQPAS